MKLMIMTDLEGVAGVLGRDEWTLPGGRHYAQSCRLLTAEVNAAVDGLSDGGATEILVVDGHGPGGIAPERLDPRAELLRGAPAPPWPWGLDRSFAGLAFVGQHAKAGTPGSHLTHTEGFHLRDLSVNGLSLGEYGMMALCARELGVPTILACGEEALCREAEALTPGVVTAASKRGLLPDGLDELDATAYARAKLSAVHLSPEASRRQIRAAAVAAMDRLRREPERFCYPDLAPPYVRVCHFRRQGETPPRSSCDRHETSFIALMNC